MSWKFWARNNKLGLVFVLLTSCHLSLAADTAASPQTYCNLQFSFCVDTPKIFDVAEDISFPDQDTEEKIFNSSSNHQSELKITGRYDNSDKALSDWRSAVQKKLTASGFDISYQTAKKTWFVLSGTKDKGATIFYSKALIDGHHLAQFTMIYPASAKKIFDPEIQNISKTLSFNKGFRSSRVHHKSWSIPSSGPVGLKIMNGEVHFCDKRGGRKIVLTTGMDSAFPQTCPKEDEGNTACDGIPHVVEVRTPNMANGEMGGDDVVDMDSMSYALDGKVHDCATDGKYIAVTGGGGVTLLDPKKSYPVKVDEDGGQHIAIGEGWVVWGDYDKITAVSLTE